MNTMAAIKRDMVKIPVVEAALRRHELAIGGTDAQKIQRLAAYYREHTPQTRLADCTVCNGVSDMDEEACPFCGDSAVEETEPEAEAQSAIVVSEGIAVVNANDLDAAVERVRVLKGKATETLWELGNEIRILYESQLWRQRLQASGEQAYAAWGAFAEAELGISNSYSYRLMDISTQFSREQVREFGPTKLAITLRVPVESREKMLAAAHAGATVTQLKGMVKEIGAIATGENRGEKGGTRRHKRAAKLGRKKKWISLTDTIVRREMVPMKAGASAGAKIRMPAPIAVEEWIIPNVLKQRIVLTNEVDGTLIVVVERSQS